MIAFSASPICDLGCQPQPYTVRRRVVLVDDEPGIIETWALILASAGYDVQGFLDPAAALEAISAGCDCVITDYHMPKMNGVELIRAARPWSKAKFLVMTGNASETVTQEALSAGACCVVHKPTSAPLVLQKIKSLCG
jgi:two-component system response regulator AtoC